MLKFIFALCFFFSQVTYGQQALKTKGLPSSTWNETLRMQAYGDHLTATGAKQYLIETGHKNLLVNESFEASTVGSGWTVGFSSPQIDTTVNMPPGKQSLGAPIFSGAGSQLYQAYADCSKLYGQSLEASIHIKSTATTGQVCSVINGTDYECITMDSSDVWKEHTLNFAAPSSGSCGIRVKSTGSAFVNTRFDDAYLGLARNIGTAAQATFVGTLEYSTIASCSWTSTSGSYASYAADTDCVTPSVAGKLSAPATKIPGFTINNMEPGEYVIRAQGVFYAGSNASVGATCGWRLTDGTNNSSPWYSASNSTTSIDTVSPGGEWHATYTSTANRSFQIQVVRSAGNGVCGLDASHPIINDTVKFSVYRFPTTAEQVSRPNNSADLLGTIFYEESGTCPVNSVKVDGSTLNATTHAALIARRTAKGIASPTVLPNLSGLFIRSAGTQTQGGVAHTAGALRAFQGDQMQGHRHSVDIRPSGGSGAQPIPDGNNSGLGTTTFPSSTPVTDGTNGTPRTGTTTRPANMAFTPCMWFVSNPAPLIASSVTYSDTVRAEGVNGNNTVAAGTYTPTLTAVNNMSAVLPVPCRWHRVANMVFVSCYQGASCITNGVVTAFRMSLPISANFTANSDLGGIISGDGGITSPETAGLIYGDTTADQAYLQFTCGGGNSNRNRGISFSYEIK